MPSFYLIPRRVNVSIFEYKNSVLIGYILFILLLTSLYHAKKTKRKKWTRLSLVLSIALISLVLANIWIQIK